MYKKYVKSYIYVIFKFNETPGLCSLFFSWVNKAYVETASTRVDVKPPCNNPYIFKCSSDTTNSALQFPFPADTI